MKKRHSSLDSVQRASTRSASIVHGELKRGIDVLATIAATAPLVGLLGTIVGMLTEMMRGFVGPKSILMIVFVTTFSQSMVLSALGLLVALFALGLHRYLSTELEEFDSQMQNASLELTNRLSRITRSTEP